MKIAIGADHGGYVLKQEIIDLLKKLGSIEVADHGTNGPASVDYPDFGRTVAENGTAGTDHGTGGAMILAGGALRGGKVYGDWPGLGQGALYQGRDLMPTADVRDYAAAAMQVSIFAE